jgi:hypothetical protein
MTRTEHSWCLLVVEVHGSTLGAAVPAIVRKPDSGSCPTTIRPLSRRGDVPAWSTFSPWAASDSRARVGFDVQSPLAVAAVLELAVGQTGMPRDDL